MIGIIAALLSTFSFLPQVIKVLKSKDTSAISLGIYSMTVIAIICLLIHGLEIWDMALIAANGVTFILASIIFICKLKYK